MFDVNKDTCIKCGNCAKVCPFTCISMETGYPMMIEKKEPACMKCSHCAAICPMSALTFKGRPCGPELEEGFGKNKGAALVEVIASRRSRRDFERELVPQEVIEEIVRISDFAPSAKNQHPQKWVVVHHPKTVVKVMELVEKWVRENGVSLEILSELERGNNIVTLGAPHLILGCGPKEGKINPYTDTTIALTDIDLLLHAKGFGACWAGYLTRITNASNEIKELLGIQEEYQVFGTLAFGYPKKETYFRLPFKEKSEIFWK